jgi:Domain of unknown function (DUF4172)
MSTWIWEQTDWPAFHWRDTEVSPVLARARLAQGRILGAAGLLDPSLTLDADVSVLVEDGVQTSAIEGERLDLDAVRSSVARHLGLPTSGLPAPSRAIDGLIDVLLDATRQFDAPLTLERLLGWQAALFPIGTSGLRAIRSGQLRGSEPMEVVSASERNLRTPGSNLQGWSAKLSSLSSHAMRRLSGSSGRSGRTPGMHLLSGLAPPMLPLVQGYKPRRSLRRTHAQRLHTVDHGASLDRRSCTDARCVSACRSGQPLR